MLVVVACVLAPVAVTAVWVHGTVFDTNGYVAAVAPLADDPAMQEAVVTRTVHAIDQALDRVPAPDAGRLGQRIIDQTRTALHREVVHAARRLVESEQFADLWNRLNRVGHEQAVAWFSGASSSLRADVVDDQLVVGLQPLVAAVAARVEGVGLAGLSGDRIRHLDPKIVIVDGPLVEPVRTTLRTLDDLALALPLFVAAALIGAIATASDRRRESARLGIGLVLAMAVALVVLRVGRQEFVDWIATTAVSVPASTAFFDTLSRELRDALRIGVVLGIGLTLGARFAGGGGATAAEPPHSVRSFVALHAAGTSVVLVLLGLGMLAVIPDPTLAAALVVGSVVSVGIIGVWIVATRVPSRHASS